MQEGMGCPGSSHVSVCAGTGYDILFVGGAIACEKALGAGGQHSVCMCRRWTGATA